MEEVEEEVDDDNTEATSAGVAVDTRLFALMGAPSFVAGFVTGEDISDGCTLDDFPSCSFFTEEVSFADGF